MEISKIMVVGAGQMGSGIAQVAAHAGYDVVLNDINTDCVESGMGGIERNLSKMLSKSKISEEDKEGILSRIRTSCSLDDASDRDLIIEAVVERYDVKSEVFGYLDRTAPGHAVLASNTSSLPITSLGACTCRPGQVVGMHFMNPVPVMKLVEIINGLTTEQEVTQAVKEVSEKLGKTPVECKDVPGFVANRILMVMLNEAVWELYEGVASPEGIDEIMKLGMNHPMGPLALADLIGLDTVLAILNVLLDGYGDPKYRPCPLLKSYVQAGWLGRKTGRGFYSYHK
jgi:3-hydroxybutyryl-CoA dehydrogenase